MNTESIQFYSYFIHSAAQRFLLVFLRLVVITTVLITSQRTAVIATSINSVSGLSLFVLS